MFCRENFGKNAPDFKACLSGIVGPENIDDLRIKLGSPVQSSVILGKLSPYFVDKYGFRAECEVVAFTGDNPASLAGLGVSDGDIAISCGTSDTLFLWLNRPQPNLEGSIFVNPIASEAFMGMLCFKNGSLTRDRIRKAVNTETWDAFSRLVATTPPGNNGSIGFYFDHPEIVPDVAAGDFRFDSSDREVDSFPPNVEARAMIEHQSLAKRLHAEFLGFKSAEKDSRVLVTGGASTNACILQVLADVFNAPVFIQDIADSAALGGAFRARHGTKMSDRSFHESIAGAVQLKMAATPDPESAKIYDEMVKRYKLLEDQIVGRSKKT